MNLLDETFMGILTEAEETAFSLHRGQTDSNINGTVAIKTVKGRKYAYIQRMKNKQYQYSYLGPVDREDVQKTIRWIKDRKRIILTEKRREKFFVKTLKGAGIIPVSGLLETVLQKLSKHNIIFGNGMLIGTLCFLAYQSKLGFSARGRSARTGDIDIVRPDVINGVIKHVTFPASKTLES